MASNKSCSYSPFTSNVCPVVQKIIHFLGWGGKFWVLNFMQQHFICITWHTLFLKPINTTWLVSLRFRHFWAVRRNPIFQDVDYSFIHSFYEFANMFLGEVRLHFCFVCGHFRLCLLVVFLKCLPGLGYLFIDVMCKWSSRLNTSGIWSRVSRYLQTAEQLLMGFESLSCHLTLFTLWLWEQTGPGQYEWNEWIKMTISS